MTVDLEGLQKTLAELTESGVSIDEAIAAAELRVKQLRSIRTTLGVKSEPKPRSRKKEAVGA